MKYTIVIQTYHNTKTYRFDHLAEALSVSTAPFQTHQTHRALTYDELFACSALDVSPTLYFLRKQIAETRRNLGAAERCLSARGSYSAASLCGSQGLEGVTVLRLPSFLKIPKLSKARPLSTMLETREHKRKVYQSSLLINIDRPTSVSKNHQEKKNLK